MGVWGEAYNEGDGLFEQLHLLTDPIFDTLKTQYRAAGSLRGELLRSHEAQRVMLEFRPLLVVSVQMLASLGDNFDLNHERAGELLTYQETVLLASRATSSDWEHPAKVEAAASAEMKSIRDWVNTQLVRYDTPTN